MNGQVLVQAFVTGVLLGSLYALISLGLTVVYGVMRIINFAHGEYVMVALYLAYFLVAGLGWDPYLTIIITVPALFVFGAVSFRLTIAPIIKDPLMNQVMLTFGLSLLLQGLALALFSPDVRTVPTQYTLMTWHLGWLHINVAYLIAGCVSALAVVLTWSFLKFTRAGRTIRAAAQNPTAAALSKINVPRTYLLAFGFGSALVGLAASLLIPFYAVSPTSGVLFGLFAFFVIVLGGRGNLAGCLFGGVVIGLSESVGAALLPGSLSRVLTLAVFVLFLLVRPEGAFSRKVST